MRYSALTGLFYVGILIVPAAHSQVQSLPNGRGVQCASSATLGSTGKLLSCILAKNDTFTITVGSRVIGPVACAKDELVRFDATGNLVACTLTTDQAFRNVYAGSADGSRGSGASVDIFCQRGYEAGFDNQGNVRTCVMSATRHYTNIFAGGRQQAVQCRYNGTIQVDAAGNVVCFGGAAEPAGAAPAPSPTPAGAAAVPPPASQPGSAPGGETNFALRSLGAVATQSSTYYGSCDAGPDHAIDGVTNAGIAHNCNTPISHTNIENQPWWQVDLRGAQSLSRIVIWNRNDVAKERLSNFRVTVKDAQGATTFTRDFFPAGGYPDLSLSIPLGGISGRIVRVQLLGSNYLNLAEVQVFGGGGPPAAPASPRTTGASRLVGSWSGTFENSKGGRGAAKLSISSTAPQVRGVWDGDAFSGTLSGNVLNFELSRLANGCRDYRVRAEFSPDAGSALVTYEVRDRCGSPSTYSGTERLTRE
ncbi:MAG: discoidin domain-containing protein [Acidobacteria bacterium]|nr:discoidin domain-containing protein [Acidobacteriota bacterium]